MIFYFSYLWIKKVIMPKKPNVIISSGFKSGKLIVIKEADRRIDKWGTSRRYWLCECECGKQKEVDQSSLIRKDKKHTKSCGCDLIITRTHGDSKKTIPEYKAWCHMKERCNNKSSKKYPIYGGRGIKVCDRWIHSYENFIEDMGRRPSNKSSIDRIDFNGDYEPSNCRWSDPIQQANNTRLNRHITYNNDIFTIAELARHLNLKYESLRVAVVNKGLSVQEYLTQINT